MLKMKVDSRKIEFEVDYIELSWIKRCFGFIFQSFCPYPVLISCHRRCLVGSSYQPSRFHYTRPQMGLWPKTQRREARKIGFRGRTTVDGIAVECVFSKHMLSWLTGSSVCQYACDMGNNTHTHSQVQLHSGCIKIWISNISENWFNMQMKVIFGNERKKCKFWITCFIKHCCYWQRQIHFLDKEMSHACFSLHSLNIDFLFEWHTYLIIDVSFELK